MIFIYICSTRARAVNQAKLLKTPNIEAVHIRIEGILYVLWSLFSHPPNETNVTLQGSDDECGSVQLVKTRELNVIASEGRNLSLGSCRQGFTVLWLYQWIATNLKQSMHKMLTLGLLSSLLARDANVCFMVPSLHPDLNIHIYFWVFN